MARSPVKKSTFVRSIRGALSALEPVAPALAARWVERLWFRLPPPPGRLPSISDGEVLDVPALGGVVRSRTWGEGDQLVYLVHGWGGSSAQLGGFIEPLVEAGYRVVAHDGLSHGESSPGPSGPRRSTALELGHAFTAVVAAHGPATGIVAHSLGAMVAATALRDGIRPERAVYVAPMADAASYTRAFTEALGGGPRTWTRFVDRLERRLGRLDDYDMAAVAAEVDVPPLLLVHDRDDRETGWAGAAAVADAWPDARLVTTSGLGHKRILADPQVVSAAVEFLAGARAPALVEPQAARPAA